MVAALIAAGVAMRRLSTVRSAALEADARQRWWETIRWVWENRYELPDDALVDALAAMEERAETAEQSIFLDVTTSAILER